MTVRHFIDTNDLTKDEVLDIVDLGLTLKKCVEVGYFPPLLPAAPSG